MEIINTEITYRYPNMNSSLLIHCNDADNNKFCTHYEDWVCLLDNTASSITDPFFTTKNKATVIQNKTNGNYQLQIQTSQPKVLTYYISNINGNTIQPKLAQNP